jgi:hypothetical protein
MRVHRRADLRLGVESRAAGLLRAAGDALHGTGAQRATEWMACWRFQSI